jgi:uncharacterized protein YndB with AHSA1/START domain
MTDLAQYTPSPAIGAQVKKDGPQSDKKWTLILVRQLRHSPEKVWQALTDPAQLREWAPFVVDRNLSTEETVNLTWVANPKPFEIKVTRADAPRLLEYADMRWELEANDDGGTQLTLWHSIDRRYIVWGTAGWHVAFDVLDRLLNGNPIGRIAGADAMKLAAWQRLVGEYARRFGVEAPNWIPPAAQKSESHKS